MEQLREELSSLISRLPAGELHAALRYLQFLEEESDPVLRALRNAPTDDEPTTAEDDAEAALAREEILRGEGIPLEKIDDFAPDA